MNYKKIAKYLVCLIPWFLSSIIFRVDNSYYNSLNLPVFAPPSILFPIIWTILYILISFSIYKVSNKANSNYKIYLLINYLSNQLFTFCFFTVRSNFLAFVDALIVLISSLYLYVETRSIDNKASKYLILYMIWNAFAVTLAFVIFATN